jgi:hypothetical protein
VGADQLLSFDDVRLIARIALQVSQDKREVHNLKSLLWQTDYDHDVCNKFWQCPSFRARFKRLYPGSNTFRILENYILHPFANADELKAANLLSPVPLQLFSLTDPLVRDTDFVAFLEKRKEFVGAVFAEKAAESSSDDVIMHDVEGGLSSSPQKRKRSASIDFQFNRDRIQRNTKRQKPDDEIGPPQSNFNPKGPG